MTALKGADGNVYLAQGNLVVGGLGVEGADGSYHQGTPTVGRIPNGATVESVKAHFETIILF